LRAAPFQEGFAESASPRALKDKDPAESRKRGLYLCSALDFNVDAAASISFNFDGRTSISSALLDDHVTPTAADREVLTISIRLNTLPVA
jgi:hypothetical protein